MSATQTLNLTPGSKQLVDLNEDLRNFKLSFVAKSKDGSDFDAVVVTQQELDSGNEPNFRKTQGGTIGGEFSRNDGQLENYSLLLKSDKPCQCEVTITRAEVPQQQPQVPSPSPILQQDPPPNIDPAKPSSKTNWKLILLVLVLVGGGLYLYFFVFAKKKDDKQCLSSPKAVKPQLPSPPQAKLEVPTVVASPAPAATPPGMAFSIGNSKSNLERLFDGWE